MGYEIPVHQLTLVAAADLSAKQYYFVKVDTAGKAAVCGAGEKAIGVVQNAPTAGVASTVMVLGVTQVVASAAIAYGANVASTATGTAVTAAGTAAVLGVALENATAAGDIIAVSLQSANQTKQYMVLQFASPLASLDDMEVLTDFVPGFAGTIESIHAVVTTATTDTTGVTAVLTVEIGAVATTGGVLTIDADGATDPDTVGEVFDGTAITALNTFSATDTISILAADVTPFTDGAINIILKLSM